MCGEENEQTGVGQDWVCFDVEKKVWRREKVLWSHRQKKQHRKITDTGEHRSEVAKEHTCNDLVAGFKKLDMVDMHLNRSGKMAGTHQSHSSTDSREIIIGIYKRA